jgi:hypothetical protein
MLALSLLAALAAQDAVLVARDAIQPSLAADGAGGFVAVFLRNGNVEVSTSTDGKTWSPPSLAIDAGGKARGGMQRGPRAAVDGSKTIYVTAPLCFDPAEQEKRYPVTDLYLAASTDGGRSFSKPVAVNDAPRKAPEALHWLAASPKGDVFAAWLDLRAREKGQDLFLAKITERGTSVSRNARVAGPVCECCAPGLAVDGKGNPVLIWREGATTDRQLYVSKSADGGKSFAAPVKVSHAKTGIDVCPMDAPAVAVSADGRTLAAAWMDLRPGGGGRDVQWTTGAGALPVESRIHDQAGGAQGHPSLAIGADGAVWCAWEDGREGPNAARIYVATSKAPANRAASAASEGKAGYPSLAAGGGRVGVAYEAGGGVSFRLLADR